MEFKYFFECYASYSILFIIYFSGVLCDTWVLVSQPGAEPMPLQWKCGILTIGLSWKSKFKYFLN